METATNFDVLVEDQDSPDDPAAEEEDSERPPGECPGDRDQRHDGPDAACDHSDDPAVGVARQKREAARELEYTDDYQDPSESVQVTEDQPRIVDEDIRVVQRSDAIDDVQHSDDQQHDPGENDSSSTPHFETFLVEPGPDARPSTSLESTVLAWDLIGPVANIAPLRMAA